MSTTRNKFAKMKSAQMFRTHVTYNFKTGITRDNISTKESVIMSQVNIQQVCPCPVCANYRAALEESIQDEICDAGFYAQIALEAPSDILREIITSIVGDEYGHARLQAALLGICPAPVSCPPECPSATGDFAADVRTAIAGELGAIRRYAELAMCAPNPEVRYLLTSIIGDEYAHTRIWNAMLFASTICHYPCG
jgi:rubrerythrin